LILNPDTHPERHAQGGEAFAWVARTLRDDVLADPAYHTIVVMVGVPGAGKSTAAKRYDATGVCVLDQCHVDPARRRALCRQIKKTGRRAVAVLVSCHTALAVGRREGLVPGWKIRDMASRLRAHPVSHGEGWDEIVRIDGTGDRRGYQ
jgi:hypothetical protein